MNQRVPITVSTPLAEAAARTRTEAEARAALSPHGIFTGLLSSLGRPIPYVYPGYIAHRIHRALSGPDPERIIKIVGEIQHVGDARYALTVKDEEGNSYRVTVEVES